MFTYQKSTWQDSSSDIWRGIVTCFGGKVVCIYSKLCWRLRTLTTPFGFSFPSATWDHFHPSSERLLSLQRHHTRQLHLDTHGWWVGLLWVDGGSRLGRFRSPPRTCSSFVEFWRSNGQSKNKIASYLSGWRYFLACKDHLSPRNLFLAFRVAENELF